MNANSIANRVELKHILYLTDFSEASESALPYASELARGYGAQIHTLHVMLPLSFGFTSTEIASKTLAMADERANEDMVRIESQLDGVPHDSLIERGAEIWPAVENAIGEQRIDMILLGTHGRTGAQRALLGSVAEEIFRRSPVPVMTIGPKIRIEPHHGAKFHRVVLPMDFTPAALAALPYAFSIAEENAARIYLLHVIAQRDREAEAAGGEASAADAMHRLHELADGGEKLFCRPNALVRYGNPAEQIVEAARELGADLIVQGARSAEIQSGASTQIKRMTAHEVVARARCPVLTVTMR